MFANNYLQRSMYVTQIPYWIRYFPLNESMLVLNYERFTRTPHIVYKEILEFVHASPTTFLPEKAANNNLNRIDEENRKQVFRTKHNTLYYKPKVPIRNETRRYLSLFFRPYNEKLADVLGEGWRGIWD